VQHSDIAGQTYWEGQWSCGAALPPVWNVDSTHFRDTAERKLYAAMEAVFYRQWRDRTERALLEVGCARSEVLPLFARKSGFTVCGIDYSPEGGRQAAAILAREGVQGEIVCCDVFLPPARLIGRFDAIVSFGLVEHFSDTREIVTAMAHLLKPGGVMFTHIPNMNGVTGWLQRFFNRAVYDIHVPLTVAQLDEAHRASGLHVLDCAYFLSNNLGVPNLGDLPRDSLEWRFKRFLLTWLTRVSKAIWWLELRTGEWPKTWLFSPYINCVAVKPDTEPRE
jgi:2-polyprenyl-3-methyl-5-hydroxy-6-metoxy-1,4-benzoquinol methylase